MRRRFEPNLLARTLFIGLISNRCEKAIVGNSDAHRYKFRTGRSATADSAGKHHCSRDAVATVPAPP